jgi:hypothetical protein
LGKSELDCDVMPIQRRAHTVLFAAALLCVGACGHLPPPSPTIPAGQFRYTALRGLGAVTPQVSLGAAGDENAGLVDTDALNASAQRQLQACGVPIRSLVEGPIPMLMVVVDVAEARGGFSYSVSASVVENATVHRGVDQAASVSSWKVGRLGGTRHDPGELQRAVEGAMEELLDVYCRDYHRAQPGRED